ncbi:MAG: aminotransferase class I/II-fold pyridoxal phosphate-dependent enzyme [Candidatus Peribacteraceae bacterium]|nr:aminotransferase class I/II-fold pyridoxal phosphate-dependent enzyme [Candidatus Peribacteraceae bacterium]
MSSPFSLLPPPSIDPIFAVAQEAGAAGTAALDATVGVILDEQGRPHVLDCVRRAAQEWAQTFAAGDFSYPPLLGVPAFREAATRLIFGKNTDAVASIAATGGTGAVALHLKLLKLLGITAVILPVPTWPNHQRLLKGFGFSVIEIPYLADGKPAVEGIRQALAQAKEPVALLLQAGCHNPTGLTYSVEQWQSIASVLSGEKHIVLLDLAYQGLAQEPEKDAAPVSLFRQTGIPLLVAWSASKNHSIYGLRTGLACAVADNAAQKAELDRHFMIFTRELHSAASVAGQHIVAIVQQRSAKEWRNEIGVLRSLLQQKRALLAEAFPRFADALRGEGMFALLPLSAEHIAALKRQNVFFTEDGRINIAGIPMARMEELIGKVKSII